jgi:hypothetical protein
VEPGVRANGFEVEPPGTILAYGMVERAAAIVADRTRVRDLQTSENGGPEVPPKDLTTLTFFFTAAYTRSATDKLEHERRTRGQERRDGL